MPANVERRLLTSAPARRRRPVGRRRPVRYRPVSAPGPAPGPRALNVHEESGVEPFYSLRCLRSDSQQQGAFSHLRL